MTREKRDIFAPWRFTYGAESRRRLASSVVAVPRALGALGASVRRPGRLRGLGAALLALPVAVASTALTAVLAYLVLINVLAYPFRPWLGLAEQTGTAWYADAWGGPTLAGAWATHTALVMLLVVPPAVWAVRGLTALQGRLTGQRPTVAPSPAVSIGPAVAEPAAVRPAPPLPVAVVTRPVRQGGAAKRGGRGRRVGATLAALGLLVACSLIAHANGIGDNLIWTPRDLTSGVALAVTLTPVAALLLLRRTGWWRSPAPLS
ncbi:hypothetical protein [Micromonospora sp. MA102]|uniref:hypothetical protein n=1 Tax=Micromonospora sp. MA102 TaxID=2952755 RepID=UPI0021C9DD86|nr:hypothetical protein [Micromonospora sp. MA102]